MIELKWLFDLLLKDEHQSTIIDEGVEADLPALNFSDVEVARALCVLGEFVIVDMYIAVGTPEKNVSIFCLGDQAGKGGLAYAMKAVVVAALAHYLIDVCHFLAPLIFLGGL